MKKILLFGFQDFGSSMTVYRLSEGVKDLGIEVKNVKKEEYVRPLGILAGIIPEGVQLPAGKRTASHGRPAEQSREEEDLPVRMLLFTGISQEELEQVLDICRTCGVTGNDLKAMLTPHNMTWNAFSLCRELEEEHANLHSRGQK